MDSVFSFLNSVLAILDQHEGAVAMLGIAITVLIFRKEVTNNYFTLERDNFNEIFKSIILSDIPEKLSVLEGAKEGDWESKFNELMKILGETVERAKYFKYAMPYFYSYLKEYFEKIEDLNRYDNWREYRTSAKQTSLVEKHCKKIIKAIINASKGRVASIRFSQFGIVKSVRHFCERKLIDRPIDRIIENRIKSSAEEFIKVCKVNGTVIPNSEYKQIPCKEVLVSCKNRKIVLREIIAFPVNSKFYFGYLFNIKFGKHIGVIRAKVSKDSNVKCVGSKKIELRDNSPHNILLLWSDASNKRILNYDVIKLRRTTS